MLHVIEYTFFEDAFPNNCFSAGKYYIKIVQYMIEEIPQQIGMPVDPGTSFLVKLVPLQRRFEFI